MMCKRLTALLLLLILLLTALPAKAAVTAYALLYDRDNGARADAVGMIQRFMLFSSWKCDFLNVWDEPALTGYDGIILCIGEDQELPETTAKALRESETPLFILGGGGIAQAAPEAEYLAGDVMLRTVSAGGADSDMLLTAAGLWMLPGEGTALSQARVFVDGVGHPLCQTRGRVTHFAWFDGQDEVLSALLSDCMQRWQWPYESAPTAYGQYFVLEYAYPFLDPAELMARTDVLKEEGVPYIIAVTPIFSNGSYPAMKRFCELLRYEQARGTGIVLRVPFVTLEQVDTQDLIHHMDIAFEAYVTYGVYPLAIQAPVSWLQSEKGLEVLRGYRTIFLFETAESLSLPDLTENIAFADGHQLVAPAWSDQRVLSTSFAQAVYLDAEMDIEEMRTLVQRLKKSRRAFKSLNEMENAVYSGDFSVQSDLDGAISLNGERQDLTYEPFTYPQNYTFDRGITQYFKDQIETSNHWVMLFSIGACLVFVTMMFLFRRQIRRELVLGRKPKKQKIKNQTETSATESE